MPYVRATAVSTECNSYYIVIYTVKASLRPGTWTNKIRFFLCADGIHLVFITGCAFAPIWRSSHNTGTNFIMWKVKQLMLVNLEGPPLMSFEFLPALYF